MIKLFGDDILSTVKNSQNRNALEVAEHINLIAELQTCLFSTQEG